MARLFVAVELPDNIRDHISGAIDRLQQAVPRHAIRWVPLQNLHLTLKFLGDVPETQIDQIRSNLDHAVARHRTFAFNVAGAGCFPTPKKPRVLWLGLHDDKHALLPLRDDIERLIAPLGFPTEKRPFSPHLTVGRVKRHIQGTKLTDIGNGVQKVAIGQLAQWQCSSISLMQSTLTPDGAIYTCLSQIPLN